MAVTRTTASQIRRRKLRRVGRNRETLALLVVAMVLTVGLTRLYSALAENLFDVEARAAQGEVLDLNQTVQPEDLLPFLDDFSESEARFISNRIWYYKNRVGATPFSNVGELSRIRVTASEIFAEEGLESFRARLPPDAVKPDAVKPDAVPPETNSKEAAPTGADAPEAVAPEALAPEPVLALLTPTQLGKLKPRLRIRSTTEFRTVYRNHALLLILAFFAVHLGWRLRGFTGDAWVLPTLLALTGIGFLEMVSIRDPLRDQLIFKGFAQGVAGGCALLFAASQINFHRRLWRRASLLFLALAIVLSSLLILFGTGPGTSDAKVNLAGFQPVEIIKILLVLFLAGYFSERWEFLRELSEERGRFTSVLRAIRLPKIEYLLPVLVAMGLVLVFFFLQRDLGPALVTSILFLLLYSVARGGGGLAVLGLTIVITGFYAGYRFEIPRTVAARVGMWLSPWDNNLFGGDHLAKTLWSLASGGFTGTGLGQGDPELVPAVHTDMILAAIGEEMGLGGLIGVLLLFAWLTLRGLRTTLRAGGHYRFFLALSLTLILALQTILIAGGVLGLLPLSGIATPFLSFGRSSMLANMAIVGMLLAISHRPGDATASLRPLHRPIRWIALGLAIAFTGLLAAMVRTQVVQADSLLIRGNLAVQGDGIRRNQYNPRLVRIARQIPRGSIVDRNGIVLASSDFTELQAAQATYAELGASVPVEAPPPRSRLYPFGGLTFHLLGDRRNRLNWAAPNTSFAERDARVRLQGYNDYAALVPVTQPDGSTRSQVQRDYRELIPLQRHHRDPEHPDVQRILSRDRTLHLSLDVRFQARVAEILAEHMGRAGSARGAAVFLDAENGDLLASVSLPGPAGSPPVDDEADRPTLLDRARYGLYPPGSVFKLVTAAAALRKDPEMHSKTFPCIRLRDGRFGQKVRGWGKPIRDDPRARAPHGEVDLHHGIRDSCNAYFAQLGTYEIGAEALLETARVLDIDVARPNTAETLQDSLPQSSFGQGQVTTTPLEMARVAAAMASDGQLPISRWFLTPGTFDDDAINEGESRAFLHPDQAQRIAEAMRAVVLTGTGKALKRVTPPIAGKTGTAEVQGRRSHAWFVGFAPALGATPIDTSLTRDDDSDGDADRSDDLSSYLDTESESDPSSDGGIEAGNEEALAARDRTVAFSVVIENGGYGGEHAAKAAGQMIEAAVDLGLLVDSAISSEP